MAANFNELSSPPRKRGPRACPWPEQGATARTLAALGSHFRAGASGEIFLVSWTCAGLAGNNFNSSCADLFRVSTSLPLPSQGVDGRDKPGQDEIAGFFPG